MCSRRPSCRSTCACLGITLAVGVLASLAVTLAALTVGRGSMENTVLRGLRSSVADSARVFEAATPDTLLELQRLDAVRPSGFGAWVARRLAYVDPDDHLAADKEFVANRLSEVGSDDITFFGLGRLVRAWDGFDRALLGGTSPIESVQKRTQLMEGWVANSGVDPVDTGMTDADYFGVRGAGRVLHNVWILDHVQPSRSNPDHFVLDTRFLDGYERKPGLPSVGGILVVDRALNIVSLEMNDGSTVWDFGTSDGAAVGPGHSLALVRFVSGLRMYSTVCTHGFGLHGTSAVMTVANQQFLPLNHTLRRLLLPTEPRTKAVFAAGVPSLLRKRSVAHNLFPLTFGGLQDMSTECEGSRDIWDGLLEDSTVGGGRRRRPWHALDAPSARDALAWSRLIREFVTGVVDSEFADDAAVAADPAASAWIEALTGPGTPRTRETVRRLARVAWDAQVIHSLLSHTSRFDFATHVDPTACRTEAPVDQPCVSRMALWQSIITSAVTQLRLVPMSRDLSDLVRSGTFPEGALAAWERFNAGIAAQEFEHELMQPDRVFTSTGV